MKMNSNDNTIWLVSDRPVKPPEELSLIVKRPSVFVYARDNHYLTVPEMDLSIVLSGYVMPREGVYQKYHHLEPKQLILELYQTYNSEFIQMIKGMFSLLIITGDKCHIYNDRSGIQKFFYYSKNDHAVFSNTLEAISDYFPLTLNPEHGAVFSLLEHFVDGTTLFNEVTYSTPASHYIFPGSSNNIPYWNSFDLLNKERSIKKFDDFAWKFRNIINNYIKYFNPKDITMTLTGGNDSRTILAALLNLDIKPRAFTFGNPESYDGIVAQRIATEISMEYNNHYVSDPTDTWFNNVGSRLISQGNSLINIHRAHRLDAIEKEVQLFQNTDMLFAGFMGGDYIKGIVYDDYITAKLVRLWEYTDIDKRELTISILKERYFRLDRLNIDYIMDLLENQQYFNMPTKIEREFAYIFNVVGAVHDAQDTLVFDSNVPKIVNIFMDIDFLELLFSSPYSMISKDNSSKNQIKRLMQPALQCNMINILAPELSDIEFAKHYSPREFLSNKVVYAAKRLYRNFFNKKYPANFPYDVWFHSFIKKAFDSTEEITGEWFDLDIVIKNLNTNVHQVSEKYWHQYSNIINIDKIAKHFIY